jgi:uncharacterized OB-fold protein
MTVALSGPLPLPDEGSLPFFEGAARGSLMLLECANCGAMMWPTAWLAVARRRRCSECFSEQLSWTPSTGRGEVYSFAVVHQVYANEFAEDVPYALVTVDLEEGVRTPPMRVEGCAPDEVSIGMRVEVGFSSMPDSLAFPVFTCVDGNES